MAAHVGEVFDGTIVEIAHDDAKKGVVMLRDPAIEAPIAGNADLPLGAAIKVKLVSADTPKRTLLFEPV